MKKMMIALIVTCLLFSAALADDFQSMTGMDLVQKKLDTGITLEKVYFTNGYGFSTSEFSTEDPEEIQMLWDTLNQIRVVGKVDESITDWYPYIVFYLSDGTEAGVGFEAAWLCLGSQNYEITNAEEFWMLTAALVEKYSMPEEGAVLREGCAI